MGSHAEPFCNNLYAAGAHRPGTELFGTFTRSFASPYCSHPVLLRADPIGPDVFRACLHGAAGTCTGSCCYRSEPSDAVVHRAQPYACPRSEHVSSEPVRSNLFRAVGSSTRSKNERACSQPIGPLSPEPFVRTELFGRRAFRTKGLDF